MVAKACFAHASIVTASTLYPSTTGVLTRRCPEAHSDSHIGSIAPERLATPAGPLGLSHDQAYYDQAYYDQAYCVLQILLALLYLHLVARRIFVQIRV